MGVAHHLVSAAVLVVLALGFTTVRPTPRGRRRSPEAPEPAWVRVNSRSHDRY